MPWKKWAGAVWRSGSDVNGAAALPGPRFGTYAAYGAHGDRHRLPLRRAQIDAQSNGVRYATPIRDYRWHRFDEGGSNAYDREEREAWQAIAQYAAGFHPDRDKHPEDDVPPIALTTLDNRLHYTFRQDNIDNITRGFWLADEAEAENAAVPLTRSDIKGRWPDEQWAAYLVKRGLEPRRKRTRRRCAALVRENYRHLAEVARYAGRQSAAGAQHRRAAPRL